MIILQRINKIYELNDRPTKSYFWFCSFIMWLNVLSVWLWRTRSGLLSLSLFFSRLHLLQLIALIPLFALVLQGFWVYTFINFNPFHYFRSSREGSLWIFQKSLDSVCVVIDFIYWFWVLQACDTIQCSLFYLCSLIATLKPRSD